MGRTPSPKLSSGAPGPELPDSTLSGRSAHGSQRQSRAYGLGRNLNFAPQLIGVGEKLSEASNAAELPIRGTGSIRRSRVIGNWRTRIPVACHTALATAPAVPVIPISPTPLMPSALT